VACHPLSGRCVDLGNRLLCTVLDGARILIAPTEFMRCWHVTHSVAEEKIIALPHGLERLALSSSPSRPADGTIRFAYIGGLS